MKTLGIIVEYNPFHTGHSGHLAKSKEISGCDTVIAVMSGNFVQRGEPAILDKWKRTQIALKAGVDLVIELPLYYAAASAGYFAKGAVTLLEKSGITDCMCFGSECGDIKTLENCAQAIFTEDDTFKKSLNNYLKQGLSYPAARSKAAGTDAALPDTPNNILGIEYLKALKILNSRIKPYTVPRSPGTAKEIRTQLKSGEISDLLYLPDSMNFSAPADTEVLSGSANKTGLENPADLDNLSSIFRYILLTHSSKELQAFIDVSEGLENRLLKYAIGNKLISDIIAATKTKRYTYLRLQRAVLHIILGMTKQNLTAYESAAGPQYIRVLGFNRERPELLGLLEKHAVLPVIVNLKKAGLPPLAAKMLDEEIRSTKIYSLAFSNHTYFNEYAIPICLGSGL